MEEPDAYSAPTGNNMDDLSILCGCQEPGGPVSEFAQRVISTDPSAVQTKVVFEALMDSFPQFLSFSQRKFVGFRGRYEFDQKRILVNSDNLITILGLHPQSERPYKILSCPIPGLKEEDIIPQASLERDDGSEIVQSLESRNIGLNSCDVELADERSEHSLSQRRYNSVSS